MASDLTETESPAAAVPSRGDAETLRGQLEEALRAGRWREGERLPTEREIGETHGLARNTVRRALQALEERGLIVRHVGRGTFRTGKSAATPQDGQEEHILQGASPGDVLECRLVFEPGLAPLVVARASQADLDRMQSCLDASEAAVSVAEFEFWDGALHDAIAVATRNQAIVAQCRTLARVRLQAEWGQLKALVMTPEHRARLEAEHRAIVAALRARDKEAAQESLRAHLLHVRAYMFGE